MIKDIDKFGPTIPKMEPMLHQWKNIQETWMREYYGLWWEMGTGKSKPIIDIAARLFSKCEIDGLLIFSDKGHYLSWILEEIPKHMPENIPIRMTYWGAVIPRKIQQEVDEILTAKDDVLDILCINSEALSHGRGTQIALQFCVSHYAMTVIDEADCIKSHKSKRWKNAMRVGAISNFRRVLTGTPITQGPCDLWAMCEFLKPGSLGFNTFAEFKAFIADKVVHIPIGRFTLEKIVRYKNLDTVTQILDGFSSRITKAECLDLPEKVYEVLYVEMSDEQRIAYQTLADEAVLQIEEGLVTAINGLVLLTKLHQVCQGHIKLEDGTTKRLANAKMDVLLDLVDKIDGKALIWCAFQEDIEWVIEELDKKYREQGLYAIDYYGKTSLAQRQENKEAFLTDPNCKWWVGTAGAGGKGQNLTIAHHVIYYSNTFKLNHRLQSEDRAHRYGQKNVVTYYDLACQDTVDFRVMRGLKEKRDIATEVLDTNRLIRLIQG